MKNHKDAVCPVDCCVPNENIVESEEELLKKTETPTISEYE